MRLAIYLLGQFRVVLDGKAIDGFSTNKARALLAYLAVESNRGHNRHTLAGLLWPEHPDKKALTSLRSALANLRRVLSDKNSNQPFLLASRQTIKLNLQSETWVDATEIDQLLHGTGDQETTEEQLEKVIEIYKGEFLEGLSLPKSIAYEEWVLVTRERLKRQVMRALYRLSQRYEDQGMYSQAIQYARRLVELDAWQERGHRQLIRLLALSGRRAEAHVQYEACRELLAAELKVEPSKETQEIHRMVLEDALLPEAETLQKVSILVLPFKNISLDQENEYFSDGLTEEIIADLSQINRIRVISHGSAMKFKGTTKNSQTIGRELNVRYLLKGNVRIANKSLRITVRFIDTQDGSSLWVEKYSGTLEDIFEIQEDVSRSIVKTLKVTLDPDEETMLGEHPIQNMIAYEVYLRARHALWTFNHIHIQRAERELLHALEYAGENEYLYATLGRVNIRYIELGVQKDENYFENIQACAEKIFSLNPKSPHGYLLMGYIHHFYGDLQNSVHDLKQVLKINPNDPDALLMLAYNYALSGKTVIARPLVKKLTAIDPLTALSHSVDGFLYFVEGRFNDGLAAYQKMYKLDPDSPVVRLFLGWCLFMCQRYNEAVSIFELNAREMPDSVLSKLSLFFKYVILGQKQRALNCITSEVIETAKWVEFQSRLLAEFFALLGETQDAIKWLENAVNFGFINYPYLAIYSPALELIRSEGDFVALLKKVKYKWEHFEI